MKFNPIISIFIGIMVSFILHLSTQALFIYGWVAVFIEIISYIFGGFIAIYYAKDKKIQYALYEGIFIVLILVVLGFIASSNISTNIILYYGIYVILLAIVGGMIALMMDKNKEGFSPLLAIIGGSCLGYSCIVLLSSITGFNPNLGLIFFIIGIISFVSGGFLSAFLVKKSKLLYGFYTGIIIIILSLLGQQPILMYKLPVIHVAIAIYIISAVLGNYLVNTWGSHYYNLFNDYF